MSDHAHRWRVTYTHQQGHLVALRCTVRHSLRRCPATAVGEVLLPVLPKGEVPTLVGVIG